jgi:cysteine desulfurase/selenocysteine lyase
MAHECGIPVLIDGAQAVSHFKVDVQALDADFYAFSSHKVYGPVGVGVLYGKKQWLDAMPPYQSGGEMIAQSHLSGSTWNELPYKFEAGTPDFIGSTALAEALDYIERIGLERIAAYEQDGLLMPTSSFPDRWIISFGKAARRSAVLSFLLEGIHPFDVGTLLDHLGIAVRTGHHCAQPLMDFLGIDGTVRASFAVYNTPEEVDALYQALKRIKNMF